MLLWEKSKDDFRFPFRVYPALKFGPVFVATFDQTCNARSLEEDKYIFGYGQWSPVLPLETKPSLEEYGYLFCDVKHKSWPWYKYQVNLMFCDCVGKVMLHGASLWLPDQSSPNNNSPIPSVWPPG